MKSQEAPDFAGPSEFGKSINVTVTPDAIVQDGASQSVVTVTALGVNGQPLANIPLRAEIRVDDVPTDFGSLSARNLVTDANGRATLVYTAPATVAGCRGRYPDSRADRRDARPAGDAANAVTRFANLRLLPPRPGRSAERLAAVVHDRHPVDGARWPRRWRLPSSRPRARRSSATPGTSAMAQWRPPRCRPRATPTRSRAPSCVSVVAENSFGRTRAQRQERRGDRRSAVADRGVRLLAAVDPAALNQGRSRSTPLTSRAAPGRSIASYSWDFGDGTGGFRMSPDDTPHTYTRAGHIQRDA